jgi:cyanate lyase
VGVPMPQSPLDKTQCGRIVNDARTANGFTWADLATAIDRPAAWTGAALLGEHPVPEDSGVITLDGKFLPYQW